MLHYEMWDELKKLLRKDARKMKRELEMDVYNTEMWVLEKMKQIEKKTKKE